MHQGSPTIGVDELALAHAIDRLADALPGREELIGSFARFVQTSLDDELVRINAVRFGQKHGFPASEVVELFLHARKLGLVTDARELIGGLPIEAMNVELKGVAGSFEVHRNSS